MFGLAAIKAGLSWLMGGPLNRAFQTVDKYIENQTDRERIKGKMAEKHMETRAAWMRAGGIKTLLLFAIPTAAHYASIVFYSMSLCKTCYFGPVTWDIAALPEPMNQWEGYIILASIGGLSLLGMRK